MTTSDGLEHKTSWDIGDLYYLKCKDKFRNKQDSCFVVKAY